MKNGQPINAVTTPTGSSTAVRCIAPKSQNINNIAPPKADKTIVKRLLPPEIILVMCGTTSPIKPIMPAYATVIPVKIELMINIFRRSFLTFIPKLSATKSPVVRIFNWFESRNNQIIKIAEIIKIIKKYFHSL